jgi:glycosyltransferase involved in cell wall biosynthesis
MAQAAAARDVIERGSILPPQRSFGSKAPKVVFGLPARNGERYLAEAIESLLHQTYGDFVVTVVDDCSTDATESVALGYAASDPRVEYERNPQRLGMVGNWRRAAELAAVRYPDAPYFAWASDHDVWHAEWLERLLPVLEADPTTVLVYPNGTAITATGDPLPQRPRRFDSTGIADARKRGLATIGGASAGWAVYGLFRAETLRRCGIYRAVILPDRLLMAEISLHGYIRLVEQPLWYRRYRPGELASHSRQRRTLFSPPTPPWYAYLPWWLPHAAVLFWTLGARRRGALPLDRREGVVFAGQYATQAWRYATSDHGLLRRWRTSAPGRALRRFRKKHRGFDHLVHRSARQLRKTRRRAWRRSVSLYKRARFTQKRGLLWLSRRMRKLLAS